MSASAFRAVVAATLVAALILALIVTVLAFAPNNGVPPPTTASPPGLATATPLGSSPSSGSSAAPSSTPALPPTPPPPVFGEMGIAGVGNVARGQTTAAMTTLRFLKTDPAAIPSGLGSFRVTLTDQAGSPTVAFAGNPVVVAPDSLGASARLVAANVLEIQITGSDPVNRELMTINGLSISAGAAAALGPIHAVVGGFTGSLAAGVTDPDLPSPATVVAQG